MWKYSLVFHAFWKLSYTVFVVLSIQAVLETIRDLMNTECIVPDWLHDIFLGYDDPGAAHYSR
jgi:hypothetical protein